MSPAVISSLFAGILIALASYMRGLELPILILAASAMCAWASHNTGYPEGLRLSAQVVGLILGLIAFLWVLWYSI